MNSRKEYNELSIKFTDVPRLCDQKFLNYMMKQEGRKQFSGGFLCYTVIPYQKNKTGLIPNVAINDSSHITSINYKEYTARRLVERERESKSKSKSKSKREKMVFIG